MYRGTQADYMCYRLEKAKTGQELLEDVSYDVECVWDDWYNLSYVVVSGYPNNSHASINDLMTLIADISGEVIKIAHDKDPGEISVVLSKEQSSDQLWFKVLFNKHYVFAQCKFHPNTNYLELLFGY